LSEAQRISIQRKLDKSGPATDPGQIQKVEDIIERLETAKQEAAEPLGRFAADQEENVEKIIHHREEIESLDLETAELNTEIDQLVQWSEAEEKVPSVKVSGTVYPGTTIKGRYAVYVFKEKLKSVLVREVRVEDEHGRSIWQMAVKSLK
jgi:predicted RNase H-like nuclease (RuvC/YqgF family)